MNLATYKNPEGTTIVTLQITLPKCNRYSNRFQFTACHSLYSGLQYIIHISASYI